MTMNTATGNAVLPAGIDADDNASELAASDLIALDWDGDGALRNNLSGDLADARHDNTIRAGWALAAVAAYADRVGGIDSAPIEQHISDLLGSLRHLADALGVDLDDLSD